jgi:hypothetical protein
MIQKVSLFTLDHPCRVSSDFRFSVKNPSQPKGVKRPEICGESFPMIGANGAI